MTTANPIYCLCQKPYNEGDFMIECDKCKGWYHGRCVGIIENDSEYIEIYYCQVCLKESDKEIDQLRRTVEELTETTTKKQIIIEERMDKIEQLKNDLKIMRVEVKEQDEEINLLKLNIENKDKNIKMHQGENRCISKKLNQCEMKIKELENEENEKVLSIDEKHEENNGNIDAANYDCNNRLNSLANDYHEFKKYTLDTFSKIMKDNQQLLKNNNVEFNECHNTNVQNTNDITYTSNCNTLGQSKSYHEQNTVFTDQWKDVRRRKSNQGFNNIKKSRDLRNNSLLIDKTNSQNNGDYNSNLKLTNRFKSLQFSNNNLTPEFGETCSDEVNDENIEYINSNTKYRSTKVTSRPQTVVNLYPDRDTLSKTVRPGHHASFTDAVKTGRKTAIFSTSITKGIRIQDFNEIYRSGSACFRRFHGSRANGMKYHVIPTMIEEKPEVVVIHTGGNDLRTPKNNPVSVDSIVNSIIDAGKACEAYGAKRIIISGVIIRKTGYMETRRREINNLLKDLCYKNGYLFIDNDLIIQDNLYDGVHLNEEGSVILAKNILHALNNL